MILRWRLLPLFGLFSLISLTAATAQQVGLREPVRWFTDQVLAPRSDWYRPDLAARQVCQVTRSYQGPALVVGSLHQAPRSGQSVRETLLYNAQGYLLRYQYRVGPLKPDGAAQILGNQFSYDAQGRLSRIQLSGAAALRTVPDLFSSKAYARWRKRDALFRRRHHLPGPLEYQEVFPDTWQLQSIICAYNGADQACWPQAVVALTIHTFTSPTRSMAWVDTVLLDPRRDWRVATPDTLAGYADTMWLYRPNRWWQLRVSTSSSPGLHVQHLPQSNAYYDQPERDSYYGAYYNTEADYGLTSFFGPSGQLQLARMSGEGIVWRYGYDAQGQPLRVETYFMHLPHRYGDTLYFGGVSSIYPILDCEKQQREALQLADGQQAVRELLQRQQVHYRRNSRGLVTQAVIQATTPQYAADVSFDEMLSPFRPSGHNGPMVKRKNWRQIQAQLDRQQQYRTQGCVPMKLFTRDTQVIAFAYKFF